MFHTLRSKLLIFFILIAFVPMIAVGFIGYAGQKQELTERVERSLAMQSSSMEAEISRFLRERVNDIEYLSRNPVIMDSSSSLLEIRNQMYYFLDIHDIYYDTYLVNDEGVVLGDTKNEIVGHDISERPWFAEAIKGNTVMSDIYVSPIVDEPALVVAAPIHDSNQNVLGVISSSFNLNTLNKMLKGYTYEQKGLAWGGDVFLLNNEGDVISHPEQDQIFNVNYFDNEDISKESLDQLVLDEEIANLVEGEVQSFSKIEALPWFENEWYIGLSVEESEVYASLNDFLVRYLIFYAIVLLLLTFAVYRLSNYLVQPIQKLVETTKSFASGDNQNREYVNAYEEVEYLNATFDHMTTQLEQRENAHKKSTMVLEATDNGVFAIDRETKRITLFNRMCEDVFQRDKEYVIGTEIDEVMTHSKPFAAFVNCADLTDLLDDPDGCGQFEIDCTNDVGEERTYYLSASSLSTVEDETTKGEMLIVFYDLTEKRQMERELIRSEKLKIAGEMSAGFAHEIRNPLTTIKGFIQLFNEQSNDENRRYYPLVIEEIDRVNKIMNELLNISNPSPDEEKTKVNVEKMLSDIIVLKESHMRNNHIKLETFFNGKLPKIEVIGNKLKQVFNNLIQNGIEAMPDGGQLNIRTSIVGSEGQSEQQNLVVQIEDSGIGMGKADMEKLGTPFFTTKKIGTGLGLTTSYRIIEKMNGAINVSSEIGKGTIFTVYIPVKIMERV
ncbi:ATP-binding protein [Salipaludibacillus sp. HK11]|uniref:ATP-binding protein n=1 Tax=Salipaludibacillus sp. HK11 TaxID=3394320 RepID=UPI0039FC529D